MANFTVSYLFNLRDQFSAKARKISSASNNAKKSVYGLGKAFNGVERGANRAGTAVGRLAHKMRAMRTVGRGIGTGGFMGLAGGGYTVFNIAKTIHDYEDAMNIVQGLMSASGKQRSALEAKTLEIGAKTKYTATEAANALAEMARAGIKAKEALSMLGPVLQVAGAAGITPGQSTDILTNTAKSFEYDMTQLKHVGDMMAAAFTNTNFTIAQVAKSFEYAAPIAASFKVPMEEITGILMALAQRGIKSSTAGTGLARMIEGVLSISTKAAGRLDDIGMDPTSYYDKVSQRFDLKGMVKGFKAAKAVHGTFKSAQAILAAFGKRGGRIMLKLMDIPTKEIDVFIAKLKNAKDTAAEIERIRMQGLPGRWAELLAAVEAVKIAMGKGGLSKDLQNISMYIRDLARGFQDLSPEWQKFAGRAVLVAGAISALIIPLGILAMTATALVPIMGAIAGAFAIIARLSLLPFFAAAGGFLRLLMGIAGGRYLQTAVGAIAIAMARLRLAFAGGAIAAGFVALRAGLAGLATGGGIAALGSLAFYVARLALGFTAIGVALAAWRQIWAFAKGFFAGIADAWKGSEIQTLVASIGTGLGKIGSALSDITGISFEGSGLEAFFNAGAAAATAMLNPIQSIRQALGWIGGKLGLVEQGKAAAKKLAINPNSAQKMAGGWQPTRPTPLIPPQRTQIDVTAPKSITLILPNGGVAGTIELGTRNRGESSTASTANYNVP
tara:strand:+ start:1068 stop:3248 length:2181 start_codon:yes stop_codon:yes gene_type:complete